MIISIVVGSGYVAQRVDKRDGCMVQLWITYIIILSIISILTGGGMVLGQLFSLELS